MSEGVEKVRKHLGDADVQAMRAAHQDSYPMGNVRHGTPERPDWGTFCIECKESWPCEVTLLLDYIDRRTPPVSSPGRP